MKLYVLNDLHIEFEDFDPLAIDTGVVVFAGKGVSGVWVMNAGLFSMNVVGCSAK